MLIVDPGPCLVEVVTVKEVELRVVLGLVITFFHNWADSMVDLAADLDSWVPATVVFTIHLKGSQGQAIVVARDVVQELGLLEDFLDPVK